MAYYLFTLFLHFFPEYPMLTTLEDKILNYKHLWFNPVQPFLGCVMIMDAAGTQVT